MFHFDSFARYHGDDLLFFSFFFFFLGGGEVEGGGGGLQEYCHLNHCHGLVVTAFASRAGDPEFKWRPVHAITLIRPTHSVPVHSCAWRHGARARTGWLSVSILCLGEKASLTSNFCVGVAGRTAV